jgi:hypothetical protein
VVVIVMARPENASTAAMKNFRMVASVALGGPPAGTATRTVKRTGGLAVN